MTVKHAFSTDLLPRELPEDRRFALWADLHIENAGAGAPGVFEWKRHEHAPFDALFESASLGPMTIGRMRGTLASAMRTATQVNADPTDQFVLAAPVSPGATSIEQRGRRIDNAVGSMVILSMKEATAVRTSHTANRWLNIMLPGPALRARAPMIDDLLATRLADSAGALKLLNAYAEMLLDGEALADPRLATLAADHCMDLAVLALGARGDAAEAARLGGLRAVRLARILRLVRQNFRDPGFCAETVATALGLSVRYVHVLLQESGTSFSERVLELRLEAALQLLVSARPIRISEAALEVGFSDLSYFNRCFRRRYGVTPTGARGRASNDG